MKKSDAIVKETRDSLKKLFFSNDVDYNAIYTDQRKNFVRIKFYRVNLDQAHLKEFCNYLDAQLNINTSYKLSESPYYDHRFKRYDIIVKLV